MDNQTTDSTAADEDTDVVCLMRVSKNSGWLRLFENTEVTIGRGVDVTYQLISPTCPLMISRLHCIFKQREDGQWTVTDRKSMNGVWVNGARLPSYKAHLVRPGDSIQIGVPVSENHVEFDYVLVQRKLKDIKPFLVKPYRDKAEPPPIFKMPKRKISDESEPSTSSKPKLYRCSGPDKSSAQPCPLQTAEPPQQQQQQEKPTQETCSEVKEDQTLTDMDNLQMYSQNILMLREQVDSTERQVASLEGQPRQSATLREEQVRELQSQLETLRAKMNKMKSLEKSFNEAKSQLEEQKTQQQEEHLKKQLENALQEQKKVIDELALSRTSFEEMLLAKNKELEVTKEEKERARAQKDEVVTQVTEVLENELQCIICSELFIEAVILNCAHGFCHHCIQQWRKKKDECPICRQAIKSQTRCLALDNCIDSMVENLSLEMKSRRQILINERKGLPPVEVIPDEEDSSDGAVFVGSSPVSSVLSVDSDTDLDTADSSLEDDDDDESLSDD